MKALKRLGEYLLARKKLSPQELEQALYIQKRRALVGTRPLLGTVLLEMWQIDERDLRDALEEQAHDQAHDEANDELHYDETHDMVLVR